MSFIAPAKDDKERLYSQHIEKLQLISGSKGTGVLSLERSKKDSGSSFVLITFRNNVGKALFTGQILESSKIYDVPAKPSKYQLKVGCMLNEKDSKPKAVVILLSFNRGDDKKEFQEKWKEAKPTK